ncbi:hypothetical protein [Streptomyces sp. NPDC057877]|uniref:hypothetical protein n=1 Tax=Streptomyces sp. NPDC057877 TaxID=3346269 RepID=UPI0036C3FDF8
MQLGLGVGGVVVGVMTVVAVALVVSGVFAVVSLLRRRPPRTRVGRSAGWNGSSSAGSWWAGSGDSGGHSCGGGASCGGGGGGGGGCGGGS